MGYRLRAATVLGAVAMLVAVNAGCDPDRPDRRIGTVEAVAEDARGLRVIARIDKPASRAAALLAAREVDGLSFGYRARGYRRVPEGRVLEDVELLEVSLVAHPLQPGARVHMVE